MAFRANEPKHWNGKRFISNSIGRPRLRRYLGAQLLAIVLFSALFLLRGIPSAYSALLGGLIFFIPNAYFAIRSFRYQGARSAKKIVHSIYKAEVTKLVLTATLFVLVFYFFKALDPFGLFSAFIGTQAVSWLASAQLAHSTQQR